MGFFDDLRIFGMPKPPRSRTPHEIKVRREQGVAGSYNHVVTDRGNLGSNEHVVDMLENGGDVFEAVEEMFGMIWYLAQYYGAPAAPASEVKRVVEDARKNYARGLEISREIHRQFPDNRRGGE